MEIGRYFIADLAAAKQYYACGNPQENKRLQTFSRDPQPLLTVLLSSLALITHVLDAYSKTDLTDV